MRRHVRCLCDSEIEGIDTYAKETQKLMTEVMLEAKSKGDGPAELGQPHGVRAHDGDVGEHGHGHDPKKSQPHHSHGTRP